MSSQGSQASLSQGNSAHEDVNDISIDTLVNHLLNAKKALNSVGTLYRANEIVSAAESALEESVILTARTGFLRTGISQQARLLEKVRGGIQVVYNDGQADFEGVIRTLDDADDRLKRTMDTLRSTMVASVFRPDDEEPRTLLDFVDEEAVETMRTSLKNTIDLSQSARAEFASSIKAFDSDRQALKSAISSARSPSRTNEPPIPPLLQELETHAAEMAVLLESLSSHFDLCANAVKHSEGGFLALKNAASNNQLPDGVTVSGVISSPNASSQLSPMFEDERREMIQVLIVDAGEVSAVVQDLELRLQEMENILPQITTHVAEQRDAYMSTTAAFTILETLSAHLPAYISASTAFVSSWQSNKTLLEEQALELENMHTFYEGYLASYDGLILEVARRRSAEQKMKAILHKAMEQVQKLHEADSREREGFRREVGDFLPSDLWGGLVRDAPRWEVGVFGEAGEEEEEGDQESTPELDRVAVEKAVKREREREKGKGRG